MHRTFPASMYSEGNSTRVRVLTYTGEEKIILTTEIKLKLFGHVLKLSAIEEDLNNRSCFSFPTPTLGGDNHKFFPSEEECNDDRVALFRSKISQNFLIYGPFNLCTITWSDPINTNTFNNICINTLSIHDIQEQFLLTISLEKHSDPSSHDKLAQITKEKGILDIINNTFVDKVKPQSVCSMSVHQEPGQTG